MFREHRIIGFSPITGVKPGRVAGERTLVPIGTDKDGKAILGYQVATKSAAQQNSDASNANAATKGVREGSNPNANLVEENIQRNFQEPGDFGPNSLTPEQMKAHNDAMLLADASNYVKPQGYNPAAGVPKVTTPSALNPQGEIAKNAVKRMRAAGLTDEEITKRVSDPNFQYQIQQTASNTGLGGTFNKEGTFIPPAAPSNQPTSAERIAADNLRSQIKDLSTPLRPDQVGPQYDAQGNVTKGADVVRAELEAQRAAQATELQKQLTEQQARNQASQEAAAAAGATGKPGEATPPATQDMMTPDLTGNEKAVADAKTSLEARLKNANDPMPGEIDEEQAKEDAATSFAAKLDAAAEAEKVQKEKALEKERNLLKINSQQEELAKIENTKSQLDQINLNTDNEVKNRRTINKLSGGHDFGGLNWVRKQTQAGLDTLNYLRDKAANMSILFGNKAIAIINDYGIDLKQAESDKKKAYAEDYEKYVTKLNDIRKELKDDNSKKRELRDKAHKDYSDVLTKADFAYGDYMKDLQLKALDRMWSVEDREIKSKETHFSQGISFMNLLTDKKIKSTPGSTRFAEKMMGLPEGSLSVIAAGSGDGTGSVPGYSSSQVQEARLAYYKQFNKLPPKDELATMVQTYHQGKIMTQAGQSTERGEMLDVYSDPFEEMRMSNELGTRYAEYARVKEDGSYKGSFLDFMKDTRSPLFALPSMSDFGAPSSDSPSSTSSIRPGVAGF